MERKIGEIFEYNGEWYQCAGGICRNCSFYYDTVCKNITTIGSTNFGNCHCSLRTDHKSVIFKKLEKVGEPFSCNYYGDARLVMMHEYQLFDVNVIYTDKMPPMYITDYKHNRIAIEIKVNKEDMEEKDIKPYDKIFSEGTVSNTENLVTSSLKPFNLEAAKSGKPVCTRDGQKARIICFDFHSFDKICCIIAAISHGESERISFYDIHGKHNGDKGSEFDLMMLPEKKEGWINIYKGGLLDTKSYSSKEEAVGKASQADYIDTIKIEWEE